MTQNKNENIYLDANNFQQANSNGFDHCDPETISHVRLLGWYNRLKQSKACKKW